MCLFETTRFTTLLQVKRNTWGVLDDAKSIDFKACNVTQNYFNHQCQIWKAIRMWMMQPSSRTWLGFNNILPGLCVSGML